MAHAFAAGMRYAAWIVVAATLSVVAGLVWLGERPYRAVDAQPDGLNGSASPRPDDARGATHEDEAPGSPADSGDGSADASATQGDAGASPNHAKPAPTLEIPATSSPLSRTHNVLLVGLDRHAGVLRGGRTDTLIVAAFDDATGHLALIGVPRDLWVAIPDEEPNRLNAVYGLALRAKRDPMALLERVLSDTLSLPIAHSLAIDLGVLEGVIDEVGGITVDVPCAIVDDFVDPRMDGGRRVLRLDAGPQHMDGPTAAMFVRSRHGRSDWSRARRQQRVLLGLRDKLGTVDGMLSVPALLSQFERSLRTDLSRLELLRLARRALLQDVSKIHGVVLDTRQVQPFRTEKNWSVLLPNPEAIAERLASVFTAGAPGAEPKGAVCAAPEAALRSKPRPGP